MSHKQRIIISITGIVLVSLILIGLTYGYYMTKINGNNNNKSISVVTANILLEYADINDELITDTKVEPGKSWTKTFVATNKGNKTVTYGVALENVVNQFQRKDDIVYTLECKQYSKTGFSIDKTNKTVTGTISGTCNSVTTETTFPSIGTILVQNDIADDKAQVYTLVVTYKNVNENQNVDMNKTFSAKANIVDPSQFFNPYGEGTLASAILSNAKSGVNGTTYREIPLTKPGEGISEYKTGKTIKETKSVDSLCAGYSPWQVGDSESAAQSGSKVSSYEEAVGKYVYDQCSHWTKKLLSYDSTNNTLTFGIDEIKPESTLSIAPDDYGTTYYYRGAVTDNYVSFADKTWRIVRINGDGSVRLILDDTAKNSSGTEIKTAFNSSKDDNAYVGYMYGTPGSTTYDATHKNINDSTIKKAVDKWYEDNLKTNYANYLSDTLFCNDKTLASNGIGGVTTQLGYGKNKTYYASMERLASFSTGTTEKPTFKCAESATNDYSRFTVDVATLSNGNKTNGNLKYPIGLLSADEVSYAGAKESEINISYYLFMDIYSWWLSSPGFYDGSSADERYGSGSNGNIVGSNVKESLALRPSINLKAELLVDGGDGTSSNPYTVKLN